MKISIISGSSRANSQSSKVAHYIQNQLQQIDSIETYVLDLHTNSLPFFDDSYDENQQQQALWQPISDNLASSDAFVLVTPEWDGMASVALKNMFHYIDREFQHKPALLVSVSASGNGAYPIAELRSSSYKNCAICYIPDHVIVRNVGTVLNSDQVDATIPADTFVRDRIGQSIGILLEYADAMKTMRSTTKMDYNRFDYGL